MTLFETGLASEAGGPENQDRGAVIEQPNGLLLVVADGAGGLGGGAEAAERVVELVRERSASHGERLDPVVWCKVLRQADERLSMHPSAGETAAVVAALTQDAVCGASVGDCGALQLLEGGEVELTAHQRRKPLLGSGAAVPTAFGPVPFAGTLVVASDGLLKYAPRAELRQPALTGSARICARALIECVRYPSGNLPDDVTVIVCRSGGQDVRRC
jgi:serine/threonine protein phosphatase PrpC